jgi:hypothetical protein
LNKRPEKQNVNGEWENIKDAVIQSASEVLNTTAVSKQTSGGMKIVKTLLKIKVRHNKKFYRKELVILKRCIAYKDYWQINSVNKKRKN